MSGGPLTPEERATLLAHMEAARVQRERSAAHARARGEGAPARGGWQAAGDMLGALARRKDAKRAQHRARRTAELDALRAGPAGPRLQRWQMRNPRAYVVSDDLDDVARPGWYTRHRGEFEQMGRAWGLAPRACALLCLLYVVRGLRGGVDGCGLQVPGDWLAARLDCTPRWVWALLGALDPHGVWRRAEAARKRPRPGERPGDYRARLAAHAPAPRPGGVPLVRHFQQLRPFARVAGDGRREWVDASGRPHRFVDVQAVTYLTRAGLALLEGRGFTRARVVLKAHGPTRLRVRCGALAELLERWAPRDATTRRRVAAVPLDFRPDSVMPADSIPNEGGLVGRAPAAHAQGPPGQPLGSPLRGAPPGGLIGDGGGPPAAAKDAPAARHDAQAALPAGGPPTTLAAAVRAHLARLRALGAKLPEEG